MTELRQTKPLAMAGEVARQVELEVVALRSATVRFFGTGIEPPDLLVSLKIDHSWESSYAVNAEARHLDVGVSFIVTGVEENSEATERLRFECQFALRYRWDAAPDLPAEYLVEFARLNGVYNAWPYVRETIQSFTSRMSLPPLVLPLLKIGPEGIATVEHDGARGGPTVTSQ